MGSYSRLSVMEREEISRGLSQGLSLRAIARGLNRAPSTVTRELARNGWSRGRYRAHTAERSARRRRRRCRFRRLDTDPRLRRWVWQRLRWSWSPEQIARRLKRDFPGDEAMRLSHEALYTYLYVLPRGELRRTLLSYLRHGHRRRRRRRTEPSQRGQIPEMISIEERPAEVADRTVPGHWESDLIIGREKGSAIGTLVERTTRTVILVPLKGQDAETVRKAFARQMRTLPSQMRLSLTHDRGKEMTQHRLFTRDTKIQVYFAHPQSPWERGTNENTNGLIRQFFPKGTDFNQVSYYRLKRVQHLLNGRPRAVLDWKTPYEAFEELLH